MFCVIGEEYPGGMIYYLAHKNLDGVGMLRPGYHYPLRVFGDESSAREEMLLLKRLCTFTGLWRGLRCCLRGKWSVL
jgi:hypothetical protein